MKPELSIEGVLGALKNMLKEPGQVSRNRDTQPDPVVERIKKGEFMWPEDEVILGDGFVMIKEKGR